MKCLNNNRPIQYDIIQIHFISIHDYQHEKRARINSLQNKQIQNSEKVKYRINRQKKIKLIWL